MMGEVLDDLVAQVFRVITESVDGPAWKNLKPSCVSRGSSLAQFSSKLRLRLGVRMRVSVGDGKGDGKQ